MEKIARGHGRVANIESRVLRILVLRPSPSAIFTILHSWQCFNWFIVLAGLFEQIAKMLLEAIERQVKQKVRSLALAHHSKAICHARLTICSLFNSRIGKIATKTSFCQECYVYLSKYTVFSGSWANTARRHKIWK